MARFKWQPARFPRKEAEMRISHRVNTRSLISHSAQKSVLGSCNSNITFNSTRRLIASAPFVSRSHFATLSCRLIASKVPIRYFSAQSEPVPPKSDVGENKTQLCEKIGFIGAGKIAQVSQENRSFHHTQYVDTPLIHSGNYGQPGPQWNTTGR